MSKRFLMAFSFAAVVFELTITNAGAQILHSFSGSDGDGPCAGLILSGTNLFGTTAGGGASGSGTVFKVSTNGAGFTTLHSFTADSNDPQTGNNTNSDGTGPLARLVLSGSTLYGTACYGGKDGYGTVFKVSTSGTGFAVLHTFTGGSDGANPVAGLILSGSTLYGTASSSIHGSQGTVFKVSTSGTGFTVLYAFTNTINGENPEGDLLLSGSTLFGTTTYGGFSGGGVGTIFKVSTSGTDFASLYSFGGDSDSPSGDLFLSGSTLYGTTEQGGTYNPGTVFSITTNGTLFTTLCSLTGGQPSGLTLLGDTLYGTATSDVGVFAVSTNGGVFSTVNSFNNLNGESPLGGVTLAGTTLYGTTEFGGSDDDGTVYAVSALSATALPGNHTVIAGGNATLTVSAVPGPGPFSYQWQFDSTNLTDGGGVAGSQTDTLSIADVTAADGGNYQAVVTSSYGSVTSSMATLSVLTPPFITLQPTNQTVVEGAGASFAAAASGSAPLIYQWQFNGTNIAGATSTNLTLSNVQPGNAGNYIFLATNPNILVTDPAGSATSAVATLTVLAPPVVTLQPTNQTVAQGAAVNFAAAASGAAPLSYQWQFNGTNLPGATATNLTLSNVQPTNTGNYTFIVSNALGSATSAVAMLTVLLPPVVTLQPTNQTVVEGATVSLAAAASGSAPLLYQWQFNGTSLAGATAKNLTLSNVQPTNAGNYTFIVSNALGSATSVVATLTLLVPPVVTLQPTNQAVAQGTAVNFVAAAGGTAPLTYQWQFNGTSLAGATGTNLTLSNVQPTNAGNYTFIVTNLAGSATSAVATLTVLTPPVITLQPTNQTVVEGAAVILAAAASGNAPLIYQWQFDSTNLAGATSTNLSFSNVQPSNAGNYTFIVANPVGLAASAVATLTVLVPPVVTLQPTNQAVAQGAAVNFVAAADGTAPLTYQWQFNGTNLPGATATNLSLSNVQPTNAGNYSFIVTNLAGSATSPEATLAVYSTAAASLGSVGFSGGQFKLSVGGVPGYTYIVQASTNLINWVPIGTNTAPFTLVATNTIPSSDFFYRAVHPSQ